MKTVSEAELMVIGAILARNTLYDDLGLLPSDFQNVDNRRMYTAIAALIEAGAIADITSLYASGKISENIVAQYDNIPIGSGKHFADLLKEATKQRQITTLTKQILDLQKQKLHSTDILTDIEAEIYKIQERKDNEVKHIKSYLHEAVSEIEDAYKRKGRLEGVMTGFVDLDNTLCGLQNGDLIIIAARTSIGKTAFALNIAEHVSARVNCLFFSCEMSPNQVCKRLLSSLGKIEHKRLINGNLETEHTFRAMDDAAQKIYTSYLYTDFTPLIPFQELKSKTRIAVRNGCKVVFVDYLTLIKYGDNKTPRWERTGDLIKELKTMARQLDIPVVVLSQLNRQAEGQTPTLAELRQSGEIEEHSDVILFLHRERGGSDTDLIIAKHRNGGTGTYPLYFDEKQVRFETGVKR